MGKQYLVPLGGIINNAFFGESMSKLAIAITQKGRKAHEVTGKLGFSLQCVQ